jgi:glycerophosphoryl diester phosphodiesterase
VSVPAARSAADPPSGLIQVVAHRGASARRPEHTLAAYRQAIADGAQALECDVRLTSDGYLVCVHDRRVDRTSSGRGVVSQLTLSELQRLDWGRWGRWSDGEHADVLTARGLFELVAATDRRLELAVETKHPSQPGGRVEQALAALLAEFGWADGSGPVRVMSFSVLAMRRMRRLAPSVPLVFLLDRTRPPYGDGALPAGVGIAGIGVELLRRDPDYVRRAHARGNAVHVWTVDEPDDVERCLAAGVEAIITNRPREVLAQLGR